MTEKKRVITRRDFIRTGSCVVMGGLVGFPLIRKATGQTSEKSRVVLIRDQNVTAGYGSLKGEVLVDMLDQALATLFGTTNPAAVWREMVNPGDIVGIKSNVWGPLPTPATLEDALVERLQEAGVDARSISVDDRGVRRDSVFKKATALINVRPMRTHHWSGLGTLLKNYIMFVSAPWMYHGNSCEKLGTIWQKPHIKGKTRLNILVMVTPLFHGVGPHHFSRKYTWPYGGLIVSTDPVAADATGARIMQAKRNAYFAKNKPISPRPLHIEAADTKFGIGNSHPDRIELVKLGWEEDILI
ncbi:MAG: DUF362 domain-containing protein [Desulfobacterales bacterium]|nr:MAG: DUF362 domain-containing protein [Desulfobacterales bacterium]